MEEFDLEEMMMPKVKIAGVTYDVPPLCLVGDDELWAAVGAVDRLIRPLDYAWAAAADKDGLPPEPARQREALRAAMPKEAYYSPEKQREVFAGLVALALARATPKPTGPVPATISDVDTLLNALWGRLAEADQGKGSAPA